MYCVNVESLYWGDKNALEDLPPVEISFDTQQVSVEQIISRAVTAQVNALQQTNHEQRQRFQRQYLSTDEIEQQARDGRISMHNCHLPPLDLATCIGDAISGFGKGHFFIAVNGTRPVALNDQIILMPNSKVQFVRLMPLVGG
ncbi:hypothetical protein [Corallincola spongiicola]|uniref:Uncharacterized protein n=1 Tax=Corallincola spongiicola TaxID=2520508 RepID=A0ABY1WSB4_9GAMM|nr:hypothetical protein [Corallincola spongiicola]TAA47473.1 hypothetical protein EXY25_09635 [Corallincola spongiicola]